MYFDRGVRELSENECRARLAGTSSGRVSVSVGGLPVVLPVAYCCDDKDVVIVTGDGAARRAATRGDVVALEIDSAGDGNGEAPWTVLVIGRCAEVEPDDAIERCGAAGLRPPSGVPDVHYARLTPEIVTGYRASTA